MKKLILIASFTIFSISVYAQKAKEIIEASGIKGGIVVHLNCNDGKLTSNLYFDNKYLVHGLDTDQKDVDTARNNIKSSGKHGKVTASLFDGKKLSQVDNLIQLIVADDKGDV